MKKLINKFLVLFDSDHFERIYKYLTTGILTTIISFGSYRILYYNLNIQVDLANTISIVLAILFAYFTNKFYVFRSVCETRKELFKEIFNFFSTRFMAMLIEIGSVFFFHTILSIHEMISKLLAGVIILIINYLVSHYVIFKS